MSNMGDLVRNPNNAKDFLRFISFNGDMFLHRVTAQLGSFVENGLFEKSPQAMDKAQLLVETFGDTLHLWDNFATRAYTLYGDMGDDTESEVLESPLILPDVEMTPVDQTVTPKTSRKKDKQKARITDDKQVKNQSITANPGAQTSVKKPRRGKNLSVPEATQILTGFKEADDQREQVRDIIVMIFRIPGTLRKS
ncbi:hypothetical protein RhiirA4_462432 [Rhizophagus irregularis]|uniref:Uncharacterized protein n=1 Tax=Rhizophagus irregularis TaxID=588596 RepID=A0A2I1GKY4_9GLOM|nr:hypothetical protein RhiirA4_462432 [Rhizophagus irregularis]